MRRSFCSWARVIAALLVSIASLALGACTAIGQYSYAAFNQPMAAPSPVLVASTAPTALAPALPGTRATFAVDGRRGNGKVLMFLALSGGGSRAAYLSAATLHALEDIGLLAEVDVISAVSGGSLAAAYYAASRDEELKDAALAARLLEQKEGLPAQLEVRADGTMRCAPALEPAQIEALRTIVGSERDEHDLKRLTELCRAGEFPRWERSATLETMKKNYVFHLLGDLFKPTNFLRYWFTSFDRSDIMVGTLADTALHRNARGDGLSSELHMQDLNPLRPYLLIHATNATRQAQPDGSNDTYPFGSIFTFTREDFGERLGSEIGSFSLPRAVMSSSAFPLAFATMSLEDFRKQKPGAPNGDAAAENRERHYLHLIDGGNADNLGLRSVKRTLLEMHALGHLDGYDRIVVLLVDAFTTPAGTSGNRPDPRSLLDLLLDTNVSDAVDALLQANRDRMLDDFDKATLHFERDCTLAKNSVRHLPPRLCNTLESVGAPWPDAERRILDLRDKLVFFHFGFADVIGTPPEDGSLALKRQLDLIPTSFSIDDADWERVPTFTGDGDGYRLKPRVSATRLIEEAVQRVIRREHPCMRELIALMRDDDLVPAPQRVADARAICQPLDRR